jgi:glycosyltransferase involved in cell wall biosynthesis
MRILFDHQVFSWQAYGGISRYFTELMRALIALEQEVLLPENFFSENAYLRTVPAFRRKSLTNFPFKGKKWLQNRLGRRESLVASMRSRPQVFHPTYFDPYFLESVAKHNIPFVLTIHDMIHEIYGHGDRGCFSLDARVVEHKRLLAEKSAAIIAVSEQTRRDILRFYPTLDPDKIHVAYHGNSLHPVAEGKQLDLPARYLLFVGGRKGYKNFTWMVENLAKLLKKEQNLHLVCVGGGPFEVSEIEHLTKWGLSGKVVYLSVRSDAALAETYRRATCFIFPSRYEGFGIPVLEAFACGCPVVLHRSSSLPEVGGDAALYFDEGQPETLANALNHLLPDNTLRTQLIIEGQKRLRQFTWEQSAKIHHAVYQSIVKK